MRGTLVITILTVQSSYIQEFEHALNPSAAVPDTIQWWLSDEDCWRIRTFAADKDIHTHSIGERENFKDTALANDQKNYGDVIGSQHVVDLDDATNAETVKLAFGGVGLEPLPLEIAPGRFAFWKPDDADYHTQSVPK